MNLDNLADSILELIIKASTELTPDVQQAIDIAKHKESQNTRASMAMNTISNNIELASTTQLPLCQDTGMPTFKVKTPVHTNQLEIKKLIHQSIAKATELGKLRTNSVDSLTGENTGNNLGIGTPIIQWEQHEHDYISMHLILKGGGCENKNIQYSLPMTLEGLGKANRDLDGVRKCILHSVYQAQGQGCSAGFIGVSIGGDRTSGYMHAKEQLMRSVIDTNPHEDLAKLEDYILNKANTLGIGTMGFGGETTLLGCKVGVQNRLPASYFVSVAYNCWAYRRQCIHIDATTGLINTWLYQEQDNSQELVESQSTDGITESNNREIDLNIPITEDKIRELQVGDIVYLTGTIYTGRDAVHKYLHDGGEAPVNLDGQVIYHCGPVMLKDNNNQWQVKGAGPTTSIREEPYQADLIKKFNIRAIIGKGGMGAKTLAGLQESGAVYLNAIGGAAQYYTQCIKKVENVYLEKFGIPEAMWQFQVERFPAIVTMDSHGNSLHADINKSSLEKLSEYSEAVF